MSVAQFCERPRARWQQAARTTPSRYQAALDALRRFPRLLTSPEARDLATEMAFQRGSQRPRLPTARAVDAVLAIVPRETSGESPRGREMQAPGTESLNP